MDENREENFDAAALVAEWWENAEGRWLLGEKGEGGYTVYDVEFWDGCRFVGYTQGRVFECVSELGFAPVVLWRNSFISEHMREMAYVIRCVASYLAVAGASELVTRLMVAASRRMTPVGKGALEHRQCFLGDNALEPVTMSFGEWVKTREMADNGGSLSSNIPIDCLFATVKSRRIVPEGVGSRCRVRRCNTDKPAVQRQLFLPNVVHRLPSQVARHNQEIVDNAGALVPGEGDGVTGMVEMDGLRDRLAEINLLARDWWGRDNPRLLPGECGGVTVFVLDFADGCRFFGYTGLPVFDRVSALVMKRGAYTTNDFVSGHAARVPYVVRCIVSGLGRGDARHLRDFLVSLGPSRSARAGRSVVGSPDCWLADDGTGGDSLPFSEFGSLNLDVRLGPRVTDDLP